MQILKPRTHLRHLSVIVLFLLLHISQLYGQQMRIPVIPVNFTDIHIKASQESIKGKLDSVSLYFNSQTQSSNYIQLELCSSVQLSQSQAYYGRNGGEALDEMIHRALIDACNEANSQIDFKRYDNNGDSYIDCILLLCAGIGESNGGTSDDIWPQVSRLSYFGSSLSLDACKAELFCVISEGDPLGTICHEFGHVLGLPDFYDTDGNGSGGECKSMGGCLSLMDRGRHNDSGNTPPALNGAELSLLTSNRGRELQEGHYTLSPLSKGGNYLRYGASLDEYYIVECRDNSLWDKGLDGSGLVIYHINKSTSDAGWCDYYRRVLNAQERWRYNHVNCNPLYPCAYLIEHGNGIKYLPSPQYDNFGFAEDRRFAFTDGTLGDIALCRIQKESDGCVSFDAIRPVTSKLEACFQDGAIISWETAPELGVINAYFVHLYNEEGVNKYFITNHNSFSLRGLDSNKEYKVEIECLLDDNNSIFSQLSFKTKAQTANTPAYINLSSSTRNDDGSFKVGSRIALRISNMPQGAEVVWMWNGEKINTEDLIWFTLESGGLLRAIILHENGDSEIIERKIVAK